MAHKPKALRALSLEDRQKLLVDTRTELMHERGLAAMGGSVKNPGKIRDLRTTIARLLTVEHEGSGADAAKHAKAKAAAPKAAKPAGKSAPAKAAPKPAAKPAAKAAAAKAPAKKTTRGA